MGKDRHQPDPTHASHIVLTHVRHKPSIIDSSHILSEYWKRLDRALEESENIVLFGYSGCDVHLNHRVIVNASVKKPVHVIEWGGSYDEGERGRFWNKELRNCDVTVHSLENILEFQDWNRL